MNHTSWSWWTMLLITCSNGQGACCSSTKLEILDWLEGHGVQSTPEIRKVSCWNLSVTESWGSLCMYMMNSQKVTYMWQLCQYIWLYLWCKKHLLKCIRSISNVYKKKLLTFNILQIEELSLTLSLELMHNFLTRNCFYTSILFDSLWLL